VGAQGARVSHHTEEGDPAGLAHARRERSDAGRVSQDGDVEGFGRWRLDAAQAGLETGELELAEEGPQRRGVGRDGADLLLAEVEGHLVVKSDEIARELRQVAMLAQALTELALHLIGMGEDAVEGLVLGQQLARRLQADLGHAGDVVGAVAHQGQEVAHAPWVHAQLLDRLGHAEDLLAHGIIHHHAGPDELQQILVTAEDHGAQTDVASPGHDGCDHVVGLVAGGLEPAQAPGGDQLVDAHDLRLQVRRRRRAVGFVVRVALLAQRGPGRIVSDDHARWLMLVEEAHQHLRHARHGASGLTLGVRERRQRVVGPEDERADVDQIERVWIPRRRQTGRRSCSRRRVVGRRVSGHDGDHSGSHGDASRERRCLGR